MKVLTFDNNQHSKYKLAILVKELAFSESEIQKFYITPLEARGISKSEIIAFSLEHDDKGKAPVSLIREYLGRLEKIIEKLEISYLLVADGAYFKVMAKVRKIEPWYGYVKPFLSTCVKCSVTINYQTLFYNPSLKARLDLGITAIANAMLGTGSLFQRDLLVDVKFPNTLDEITETLKDLLNQDTLTCDIETYSLQLKDNGIASIAFGSSSHEGCSFTVRFRREIWEWKHTYGLLKEFFLNYKGKLIFHNATFDTKMLIRALFMNGFSDYKGMLEGLHCLYRDLEDTKILAYLATNTTAGNSLSLKDLAFEFTGNYAVDDISNVNQLEPDDLLRYNATDALATFYVYKKYREEVRENQEEVYTQLFRPALKVLTQTELVGLPFDMDEVEEVDEELSGIKDEHLHFLESHKIIKQFENVLRLQTAINATEKLKVKVKTADDYSDLRFNSNSSKQLRQFLYEQLELPVFQHTDTGLPSTNGKSLEGLITWLTNTYDLGEPV